MGDKEEAPTQETHRHNKDYNPRWQGYMYIIFSSLICFASISNVPSQTDTWGFSLSIGVVTFTLSIIIISMDRVLGCFGSFRFHKALDGKLEGWTLVAFVGWWIAGLIIMTRAGGLAYNATNIYFSSWLALASCVYTLNEWSGSKDIVTLRELTSISPTLRGWYCLLLCSVVVLGAAANLLGKLTTLGLQQEAAFAVSLGVLSTVLALIFILAHYRFFSYPKLGGWTELSVAFFIILFWIVGVGIVTQDDGIASTPHGDCEADGGTPGSNTYVFSWLCLASGLDIALQWKQAQALSFAQASKNRLAGNKSGADEPDSDEDDDDEI